jgi:bifunctional non-homologous end joining protein LigD
VADKLSMYRRKRSVSRTPEPVPAEARLPRGNNDTFVIQEHHARRLHWDFRLERGGVLVSWAIPKGLPLDPKRNHLAVRTEDHPLDYAAFEGEIPSGQYGAGLVKMWDRGTYECEVWTDDEIKIVLHGTRVRGRYVLIHTGGDNWLIHRMDPPPEGWEPMPELVRPMLATLGSLPPQSQDAVFGYEMKWDGLRAVSYVDGGRVRLMTRNDLEVSATYPELGALGEALGATSVVLDGEIVAVDRSTGRISFAALQPRMHVQNPAQARRLSERVPVTYRLFDVLYLDGRTTIGLSYQQRRELLESLELRGPRWDTPPYCRGGGAKALAASIEQGLEGVVAKRLDSVYEPGRRSRAWIKVKHASVQEVVIGGWRPARAGAPRRSARCCWASRKLAGCVTSAGSAPASPRKCLTTCTADSAGWNARPPRSPASCRRPTQRTRAGSRPNWSAKCASASGPAMVGCVTRPGGAYAPTSHPTKCNSRCRHNASTSHRDYTLDSPAIDGSPYPRADCRAGEGLADAGAATDGDSSNRRLGSPGIGELSRSSTRTGGCFGGRWSAGRVSDAARRAVRLRGVLLGAPDARSTRSMCLGGGGLLTTVGLRIVAGTANPAVATTVADLLGAAPTGVCGAAASRRGAATRSRPGPSR